jgi:hypothetical protein
MDLVDRKSPEHAAVILKILDLARFPHHCNVTERVKIDLIRLKLSKGDVLEAAIQHLKGATLPIYCELQTMYEKTNIMGYIFCPLIVSELELYVKLILPPAKCELDERLLMLAAHEPKFPCPEVR